MMMRALLLDRDGTLIVDTPGNDDPQAVTLMPTARAALVHARSAGLKIAVVTNQPGIGDGTLPAPVLEAIHARIEELAGRIDAWFVCPHAHAIRCACRKPQPGLILAAAEHFGIVPSDCVVVGDIGADVEAAYNAGAPSVLVPTDVTRTEEVLAAPRVATSLLDAVRMAVPA